MRGTLGIVRTICLIVLAVLLLSHDPWFGPSDALAQPPNEHYPTQQHGYPGTNPDPSIW